MAYGVHFAEPDAYGDFQSRVPSVAFGACSRRRASVSSRERRALP